MKRELDICIISEVHLGTIYCNPLDLLKYLKSIQPGFLVINGNLIDKNQFRKKYFSKKHLLVVHQIMQMALDGTKVVIITGDKDHFLRRFSGVNLGNIHLRKEMVLKLQGREYLIKGNPEAESKGILPGMKKRLYRWRVNTLHRVLKRFPSFLGVENGNTRRKLWEYINLGVPSDEEVQSFVEASARYAAEKGYDAVICGKILKPGINTITINGKDIQYLNSGDWLHNFTALEFAHGNWSIYYYSELDYGLPNPKLQIRNAQNEQKEEVFIVRKPMTSSLEN
jgi:UDP-2,3-diacylglucosamine pyrophosphatase LpxH